jgi:hypothetical protein
MRHLRDLDMRLMHEWPTLLWTLEWDDLCMMLAEGEELGEKSEMACARWLLSEDGWCNAMQCT